MTELQLPILEVETDRRAGTRMGRRRALVLLGVHAVIALHIGLYLMLGRTLAPLEPSEASYTISEGFLNAGAVFFVLLIISTLIFGRFFCGWACHVVALQDAARWVLVKLGLRPVPIRARLLMFVPLFAAFWLFGLPLLDRVQSMIAGEQGSELSLHLTTDDFWRTFPGPVISVLTFLVCGFLAVLVFGSKGFCTYGCPYGGIFAVTDRFAKGRIRVNESCVQSGDCTRNCSSGVDVAHEVAQFGMVVDPGCMKCMDCVTGCTSQALSYRLSRKGAVARQPTSETRIWDYTWPEEITMLISFAIFFTIFKNLYQTIPLLLAIGIATIVAYMLIIGFRIVRHVDVSLQHWSLKRAGRVTRGGIVFLIGFGVILGYSAHAGAVQWRTRAFNAVFRDAQQMHVAGEHATLPDASDAALAHANWLDRWSLVPVRGINRIRGEMHRWQGQYEDAINAFQRELLLADRNPWLPTQLALAMLAAGRTDEARQTMLDAFAKRYPAPLRLRFVDIELERIIRSQSPPSVTQAASQMRLMILTRAHAEYPGDAAFAVRLCDLLMDARSPQTHDPTTARQVIETASRVRADDGPLLARLAAFVFRDGDPQRAARIASRAATFAQEAGDMELAAAMREDASTYQTYADRQ